MINGTISFDTKEDAIFFINSTMEQFDIDSSEVGF